MENPSAVEVGGAQGEGAQPGAEVLRRQEAAVEPAEDDRDVAAGRVGGGDIEAAVAVEIGEGHGGRSRADAEAAGRGEGGVPVVEEEGDAAAVAVGGCQVDIHKHRDRPELQHAGGSGDKRIGWDKNLIALLDTQRLHGQLQRDGSIATGHTVFSILVCGELFLKFCDVLAVPPLAASDDFKDRVLFCFVMDGP